MSSSHKHANEASLKENIKCYTQPL